MTKDVFIICALILGLAGCKTLSPHSCSKTPSYGGYIDPLTEEHQKNVDLERQLAQKREEALRYQAALQEIHLAQQQHLHDREQRRLQQEMKTLEREYEHQNRLLQAQQELRQRREREAAEQASATHALRVSEEERMRCEQHLATTQAAPQVPSTPAIQPTSVTQPPAPPQTPAVSPPPAQHHNASQPTVPAWEPTSGNILQAGEVMLRLRRENGDITPSREKMIQGIQEQLHLTESQALQVYVELME